MTGVGLQKSVCMTQGHAEESCLHDKGNHGCYSSSDGGGGDRNGTVVSGRETGAVACGIRETEEVVCR
jgi:hypothetical protein